MKRDAQAAASSRDHPDRGLRRGGGGAGPPAGEPPTATGPAPRGTHALARAATARERLRRRPARAFLRARVRDDPARVYVPNSQSNTVDVIAQRTGAIVDHFAVGALPQHVTPSWDLRTLWVTNDLGNSLTPIDPRTGSPGKPVPVARPLQPVLHRRRPPRDRGRRGPPRARLPRAAHDAAASSAARCRSARASTTWTTRPTGASRSSRASSAAAWSSSTCAASAWCKTIALRAGAMPQDVKLSPDGRTFYVADMASRRRLADRRATDARGSASSAPARGAHGLYPSRDAQVAVRLQPRRGHRSR